MPTTSTWRVNISGLRIKPRTGQRPFLRAHERSVQGRGSIELEAAIPGPAATDGELIWVVQDGFRERDPGWLIEVDADSRVRVGEPLEVDIKFQGTVASGDGYVWVTGDRVLYRIPPCREREANNSCDRGSACGRVGTPA
jgi:hypothetical protein